MAIANNPRRVITGEARLSYVTIAEPESINGGPEKYSVAILIPKSDTATLKKIEDAIEAALQEGIGKFGGKIPPRGALKLPLRDGDTEREDEVYAGHYFLNANSRNKPQCVDAKRHPITDLSEVYSGCYGRVVVDFFAFSASGNKGVACGLGPIQKLRDGEPLGGGVTAEDAFGKPDDDPFGDSDDMLA